MLDSHSAALLLRQQVFDLLTSGQQLTLTLNDIGSGDDASANFVEVCRALRSTISEAGVSTRDVGIVVDAASVAPGDAWEMRGEQLGAGPLFVSMAQRDSVFWKQAWELRGTDLLQPVYAPHVLSQTRLLPDERAPGVIAGANIQVPTGTAWVLAEFRLADVADSVGIIDETAFEKRLTEIVQESDKLHSTIRWPTAQMRHDAWLNRRLAINVTGFGELVQRRGLDPRRFAALNEMNALLQRVRETLFGATHHLACRDGIVPALDQADPGRLLPGGRIGEGWAWRWRQALEAAAVRNRNLLALSPWSLFPPGAADTRFANLLPLLRHADVCSFAGRQDVRHWNLRDFKTFHQQAAAVLQQRGATHQIAVHA